MMLTKLAIGASLLLLHASDEVWAFDPHEFLVKGLEDIEPAFASFKGKMYSGMLPFDLKPNKERGRFMFWLFEPSELAAPDTLSIYISGGPYCSSIGTGALFEHAPITVPLYPAGMVDPTDKDEPFVPNPHSWATATNMLYIEQPAGTGFSYGEKPSNEDDVSRDLYNFLINFFNTFEHLKKKYLYIWGGSYSGMMVPSFARKIVHENKRREHMHVNLAGIGLGNAWLDPNIQGPAAVDFAHSHGMIDSTTRDNFHAYWKDCKKGLPVIPPMHPFDVTDECGLDEILMQAAGDGLFNADYLSPNVYDITTWDPYNIIGNDGTINKFYNNRRVQRILHAPPTEWYGCAEGDPESTSLKDDKPESVVPYVAELLDEAGIRVLFYNGDRDLICCHTGTEMLIDSMSWSNTPKWRHAPRGVWMVNDRVAGYTKSLGNLEFVVVYNSGHMVPYNQPERSLDMVKRFLLGKSLLDVGLPSYPDNHQNKESKEIDKNHGHRMLVLVAVLVVCFEVVLSIQRYRRKHRSSYEVVPNGDTEMVL